jgi:hypothetical protein
LLKTREDILLKGGLLRRRGSVLGGYPKKTFNFTLFRTFSFFFVEECLLWNEKEAQRGAVSVDGALDRQQDHTAELQLCADAVVAVPRAVPRATQGDGAVLFLFLIRAAPGQIQPVQVGVAVCAGARTPEEGVQSLIREGVHFEEQERVAAPLGGGAFNFTQRKKNLVFFGLGDRRQKNRRTEGRAAT